MFYNPGLIEWLGFKDLKGPEPKKWRVYSALVNKAENQDQSTK